MNHLKKEKFMKKIIIVMIVNLLFLNSNVFGYRASVFNNTDDIVEVNLHWQAGPTDNFWIAPRSFVASKPGRTAGLLVGNLSFYIYDKSGKQVYNEQDVWPSHNVGTGSRHAVVYIEKHNNKYGRDSIDTKSGDQFVKYDCGYMEQNETESYSTTSYAKYPSAMCSRIKDNWGCSKGDDGKIHCPEIPNNKESDGKNLLNDYVIQNNMIPVLLNGGQIWGGNDDPNGFYRLCDGRSFGADADNNFGVPDNLSSIIYRFEGMNHKCFQGTDFKDKFCAAVQDDINKRPIFYAPDLPDNNYGWQQMQKYCPAVKVPTKQTKQSEINDIKTAVKAVFDGGDSNYGPFKVAAGYFVANESALSKFSKLLKYVPEFDGGAVQKTFCEEMQARQSSFNKDDKITDPINKIDRTLKDYCEFMGVYGTYDIPPDLDADARTNKFTKVTTNKTTGKDQYTDQNSGIKTTSLHYALGNCGSANETIYTNYAKEIVYNLTNKDDINLKDSAGNTPLDVANYSCKCMVNFLIERGAKSDKLPDLKLDSTRSLCKIMVPAQRTGDSFKFEDQGQSLGEIANSLQDLTGFAIDANALFNYLTNNANQEKDKAFILMSNDSKGSRYKVTRSSVIPIRFTTANSIIGNISSLKTKNLTDLKNDLLKQKAKTPQAEEQNAGAQMPFGF